MVETKIICDKCKKPIIDGAFYSELRITNKYKPITDITDSFSILLGATQTANNDIKFEICSECATKIKEELLSNSK